MQTQMDLLFFSPKFASSGMDFHVYLLLVSRLYREGTTVPRHFTEIGQITKMGSGLLDQKYG